MIKWLKNLIVAPTNYVKIEGRDIKDSEKEDGHKKKYNYTNPNSKINYLRERSQDWTDNDLKEIVECIYFLNNKILELSNSIHSSNSYQPSRSPKWDSKNIHPLKETPKKQLDVIVEKIGLFKRNCKELMGLIEKNEKEAKEFYETIFESTYRNIKKRIKKLNEGKNTDPDDYNEIIRELKGIHYWSLSIQLCSLAWKELPDKQQKTKKFLRDKIESFSHYIGLDIIEPSPGQPYNESEQEAVKGAKSKKYKEGSVLKTCNIGFKIEKTGEVKKKAQIIIVK